jgi:hypothetical protein
MAEQFLPRIQCMDIGAARGCWHENDLWRVAH